MNKHLDKYDPKCFKTRQIRQFGGHLFVHIFAMYVGVGVAKRVPNLAQGFLQNLLATLFFHCLVCDPAGLVQITKTTESRKYEKLPKKKYKILLPGLGPENTKKILKKCKMVIFLYFLYFSVIFSYFRAPTREGGFCIFFGIFSYFRDSGVFVICTRPAGSQCLVVRRGSMRVRQGDAWFRNLVDVTMGPTQGEKIPNCRIGTGRVQCRGSAVHSALQGSAENWRPNFRHFPTFSAPLVLQVFDVQDMRNIISDNFRILPKIVRKLPHCGGRFAELRGAGLGLGMFCGSAEVRFGHHT